ncbi:hypothetical protein Mgra_00008786 [Meloidogyne graminicola]|uniref:Uncharacterized protein n=1 Tax=Meloidogyne graminicola TaxID=189291 RepID=A0A8S9ZER8_9BILA|nr:hypothetical protein Mgra_00008786 [Meloidogyne graminicola]
MLRLNVKKEKDNNQFVGIDSSTFKNNKHGTCEKFLACERRRINLQNNYGNNIKMSCVHLLNKANEFGIKLKLRHKRRISSKKKIRACFQKINKSIKKNAKKDDNSKWPKVVVAGVGSFPSSHIFPEKQQSIPYGNMKEIEYELERNPTPSVDFTDISTYSSLTTTITTTTTPMHNSKENKKAELEITKNLENERRHPPEWMTQFSNNLNYPHRPSQYMADHQPRGIFPATRRVQQQRKTAAAIKQLVGNNKWGKKFEARKSFALPSWVNLTEMRIIAARPHLAKLESWRLLNAAKAAKERIQKQMLSLSAKAFGVTNEKINNTKINLDNKNIKPYNNSIKTTLEQLTTKSSTLPTTSLYDMKFTQIWTKRRSLESTTTIKTTLNLNITLKKNKTQEDDYSSLESVIDPKSWEDIDVFRKLSNVSLNLPNKKQPKTTTPAILHKKLNTSLNKTNSKNKLKHSGQAVMNQSLLKTPKKRVEITMDLNKNKLNKQKTSNSTKNHTHLSASKTFISKNFTKNQNLYLKKLINSREELEHLRHALIKNLEKFLKNKKEKLEAENVRQKRLNDPTAMSKKFYISFPEIFIYRKDLEMLDLNSCCLYIICKNYLKQINSFCSIKNINSNKRRKHSIPEKFNLDTLKLAQFTKNKFEKEIIKSSEKCKNLNWALLQQLYCTEKIIQLQQYCQNLGNLNCQNQINSSGFNYSIKQIKQRE